jgi:hypothetical protein
VIALSCNLLIENLRQSQGQDQRQIKGKTKKRERSSRFFVSRITNNINISTFKGPGASQGPLSRQEADSVLLFKKCK